MACEVAVVDPEAVLEAALEEVAEEVQEAEVLEEVGQHLV